MLTFLPPQSSFVKDGESSEDDDDDLCTICYAGALDTTMLPCKHRSCFRCISRHLLNEKKCKPEFRSCNPPASYFSGPAWLWYRCWLIFPRAYPKRTSKSPRILSLRCRLLLQRSGGHRGPGHCLVEFGLPRICCLIANHPASPGLDN